ncbi:ECF transporter S component [Desemzia sp. FAM 23989]|uniref:ECF transporter S component n=1 Tax=Desemzia sp. FAM 23989 TaxID=3259523 RepID=UPI003889BF1D
MAIKRSSKRYQVQHIALLGILTTLCYISRLLFQFLPNVQPVTVILLLITLTLGTRDGLIVAILSILISNINLGLGVWTIAQIASFTVIILLTGSLTILVPRIPFVGMILYAGLTGYIYGFVISAVQAPFFGIQNFWAYYLAGLPFDTMHALGNSGFYFILAPILVPIMNKFLKKYYR